MRLRLDRLAVLVALSTAGCAIALALVPAACIPDLPSSSPVGPDARADAGPPAPACGDGVVDLAAGEQCDPGGATPLGCSATCQVVCDGGFHWSRNDHCYVDVPPGATSIGEATMTRCTGATTHVVTFASGEELAAVVGVVDAGLFWVGMLQSVGKFDSVTTFEPGWDPGCSGCFAQTPGLAQPLPGVDAGQACVEGTSDLDASWQQIACQGNPRHIHTICEREPQGRLSRPCATIDGGECFDLRFTHGDKSYVYVKVAAPADVAEQQCESLGGTLVVLQSRDEREQLWKELQHIVGSGSPFSMWIGLSQRDGGADWSWADDASEDAYASPWGDKEPRDGASQAFLYQNGGTPQLVDDTLARVPLSALFLPYVCQMAARDW